MLLRLFLVRRELLAGWPRPPYTGTNTPQSTKPKFGTVARHNAGHIGGLVGPPPYPGAPRTLAQQASV